MRRALLGALLAAGLVVGACGYSDPYAGSGTAATAFGPSPSPVALCGQATSAKPTKLPDGLEYIDLQEGTGKAVASGDQVQMLYTGWVAGTCAEFDSTASRNNAPFPVTLGAGSVIKGWDEGIPGMKVNGVRKLIIPPALGYASQAQGSIPPNSTLIFDVTLIGTGPLPSPSPSASPKPSPSPSP